ncbi:MAG TPA: mannosyltransferase family protein [Chroococcales cyanobacterium]|jgi:Gpi18-like mannosyltransferase
MEASWKRSLGVGTLFFLFSRLWVFLAISAAARFLPLKAPWSLDNPLLAPLCRWDSGWYLDIVKNGYHYVGGQQTAFNVAFFPLYPLSIKLLSQATHLSAPLVGLFLSNLFLWMALALFHRLVSEEFEGMAGRATFFLAFFPTTVFFSSLYTESLFLLLSLLSFRALRKKKFLLFGLFGGLASGTRLVGIALALPALFALRKEKKLRLLSGLLLLPLGLFLYMAYLWLAFRDPLAFVHASQAPEWHRSLGIPWLEILKAPFLSLKGIFSGDFEGSCVNFWFLPLFGAALATLWHKENSGDKGSHPSYSLYLIAGSLVPLASNNLDSLSRYLMVLFPAYVAMAIWSKGNRLFGWLLAIGSALLAFLFAALFSRGFWVA